MRLLDPAAIGRTDALAQRDTVVHRLDPRSMMLATAVFAFTVVSFPPTTVTGLLPLAAFPLVLAVAAGIPADFLWRRMLLAAPFAVMVGVFNPLLDRHVVGTLGELAITRGWLTFASIMVRFTLTVAAALVLVATMGIHRLCGGLERVGVPRVLTIQGLFLYRYLFVVADEAARMARAASLRSGPKRALGPRVYASLVGSLLLRSVERAQRVHQAMAARGFDGSIRTLRQQHWRWGDTAFVAFWLVFFAAVRFTPLASMAGAVLLGAAR